MPTIGELKALLTLDATSYHEGMATAQGETTTGTAAIKAGLDATVSGTKTFVAGLAQATQAVLTNQHANQDAAGALGVFGVNLAALDDPLTAVAGLIKSSMDETSQWASTIDKLSRASGESATATSTMAVVFEDFGIKADGLDRTIKTMTSQGLQFNMETIKKLAVEYQAITDPVARNEFAFKNFGRSALELTEILSKTPAELQAVGDAAGYSGRVIDDQMVTAMQAAALKTQQANDKLAGFKISLGSFATEEVVAAGDSLGKLAQTYDVLGISILAHTGLITWDEAKTRTDAVVKGNLAASIRGVTRDTQALNIATKEDWDALAELTPALTAADLVLMQYGEDSKTAEAADVRLASALGDSTRALKSQADQALVTAGISGVITQATETYTGVIDGNAKKITDLTTEIAKYQAAQGQAITITEKGSATQQDYETAVAHLRIAQERLSETHSKSQATLDSLNLSVQLAQDKVDGLSGKMGSASTTTADYSKKIGEDQAALDLLTGANATAAAAVEKTTGNFILQQLAIDLKLNPALKDNPALELEVARTLGLVDEASYKLAKDVLDTTNKWGDYATKTGDVKGAQDGLLGSLGYLQKGVEYAAGVVPPLSGNMQSLGGAAHHAADDVGLLRDNINSLQSKTIYVNTINTSTTASASSGHNYVDSNGVYHYAKGADFIVPPGFSNDTFPIMAQTGERVTITPAGQTGGARGDTINVYYTAQPQDQRSLVQDLALFTRIRKST